MEFASRIELDPKTSAVLVVDMQNDFVEEGGALRVPSARATVKPIKSLVERARAAGARVIFTQDTHYEGDPEFSIWGVHAKKGTWGWQIVEELSPRSGDIVVEKTRYDAFYGTPLDDILRVYGIRDVVIVGTVANICVLHTAAGAALRWYRVIVPGDSVSAISDEDYWFALRHISQVLKGVIVKSADDIVFRKQRGGER